ncbi:large subunit ribosomal protein L22 [Maritalea mobilis]|uniref:Large ribosomal subunit protein uL22 n=1 Tax=Maritalea mobilis TaxID=483324 RepID=A0A4R6VUW2_9HYPH|nr:50S ribosomal protein L22 [Maritalea mobilis]TDQ66547.1 large subunit ribosomal protein L22 [Maritalea mobilis]
MGKPKRERTLKDNEARAVLRMLRTSPQKLNLVASAIRGKKVEKALAELTFSQKRIAKDVKKTLESAIANAENNHGLDTDALIVAEAYVGKSLVMKRFRPRARGRVGKILKPFSHLTIVVREVEEAA